MPVSGNYREVEIAKINVGDRYRKDLGDIESLAASIKDKGVIQPITIDTEFSLVAGERRLKAAILAGLDKIPALIRKIEGELDLREIELTENIERKDMTWQERAELTRKIFELKKEIDPNWSIRMQSKDSDVSLGAVSQRIQLAEALEIIPELGKCKTEGEALKRLKRIEGDIIIGEMVKRAGKKLKGAAQWASDHYKIGNVLKELPKLKPHTFHFAEVDPPYAINLTKAKGKESNTDRYREIDAKDYPTFVKQVAKGTYNALDNNAFCVWWYGCEWYQTIIEILQETGFAVNSVPAVWIKDRGQTSAPESSLASAYEPFLIARKGQPKLRKMGRSNVFDYTPVGVASKIHPTEKPIELLNEILEVFAYPGASVLVPFLGSGVTLRACYKHNMVGVGWDLDEMTKNRFLTRVKADALEEESNE